MKNILTITICVLSLTLVGQELTIPEIDAEVERIEKDANLKQLNFDANKVYEQTTDGGGTFQIWIAGSEIRKISQNIFLSNAQFITTVYLKEAQPILISETEKHFVGNDDPGAPQYNHATEPDYEEVMYTSHWDKDPLMVETKGESLRTETICGISDYLGMLEIARKALTENPAGDKN